jgi:hypothetical protein
MSSVQESEVVAAAKACSLGAFRAGREMPFGSQPDVRTLSREWMFIFGLEIVSCMSGESLSEEHYEEIKNGS